MNSSDTVKLFMRRARDALDTARYHISKGIYDWAAFEIEQSLQLFLKGKLLESGVAFPSIHEIRKLVELLGRVNNDSYLLEILKSRQLELSLLEEADITSRYIPKEIGKDETLELMRLVEEVINHEGGFDRYNS